MQCNAMQINVECLNSIWKLNSMIINELNISKNALCTRVCAKEIGNLEFVYIFSPLDQPTINPNKPPLYSSMSVDESEPIQSSSSSNSSSSSSNSSDSNSATKNVISTSYAINQTMQSFDLAQNMMTFTKSTQTTAIEMTSVGTQTDEYVLIIVEWMYEFIISYSYLYFVCFCLIQGSKF